MKTDKIKEVMNLVLKSMEGSIENDQIAIEYLDAMNWLISTLFYVYSGLEKLPAEIELLKAEAEKTREELAVGKIAASSVKELVKELLNDV